MNLNRRLHRWGAVVAGVPLLVIVLTGILLQLKKEWTWVQPPTQRGAASEPKVPFDEILATARAVPEAQIKTWDDVDRLDVRPGRGIVKVRAKNRWEIQIDTTSGEILQVAYRRSDWIESLHDGSWFHDRAKIWVFLPAGALLLSLWITGAYLWWQPIAARRRRNRKS